ncbi:MAG: hypothetical protein QME81_06440 [bacterium]|nr:hypothetical protein [bacterium]
MPLRDRDNFNCPGWRERFNKNIAKATYVAEKVPSVRVDGNHISLKKLIESNGIIPISVEGSASKESCEIEEFLELGSNVYFYLGRACPAYGDYAIALSVEATNDCPQSWTPFDTGAMYKFFASRGNRDRAKVYIKEALEQIRNPRQDFAWFLATYFNELQDYWREEKPVCPHPEGLYDYQSKDTEHPQWTVWTWEVGIEKEVDLRGVVVAWSLDKHSCSKPLKELRSSGILEQIFSTAKRLKFNEDDIDFCKAMERWVLKECDL